MSLTCTLPIAEIHTDNHETKPEDLANELITKLTEESNKIDSPFSEDSFFVCDLGIIYRQFQKWQQNLPFIKPHYAVKCNNDPQVLRVLAQLGCNFDCASYREIEKILSIDVDPSRIIYANTVKSPSYIRWARDHGVKRMTVDNVDELYKIKEYAPNSELLLRIITDDSEAVCQLSCKFGAPLSTTGDLLSLAQQLGLKVVGVAFHVGSGGSGSDAYPKALKDAAHVFKQAKSRGIKMTVLDIGGGFEDNTFEHSAKSIRDAIDEFGFSKDVEIVAEPGRFMVADAFTLVSAVIGRREMPQQAMLYITDGCYANLNCIIYDHQSPTPLLLNPGNGNDAYSASVWGPTCDGIDCVTKESMFNREVKIGDWLYFKGVGAYTLSASTTFNGFNFETRVHYVCSKLDWC